MKDQVLSIERMQRLKELGVDTRKKGLFWVRFRAYNWFLSLHTDESLQVISAFTLQDILDLIPKDIITNDPHRDNVRFVSDFYEKVMGYAYHYETCGEISYYCEFYWVDNIIDAAYQMLLWCIENGYIKTNKED